MNIKAVIGGGVSGLAAAYYLRHKFPAEAIKLYESSTCTGGCIKSRKLPNGYIFEQGPRTLVPSGLPGYNTLQLIDDLNIRYDIIPIYTTQQILKNRMVYIKGQWKRLPSNIHELLKIVSPLSRCLFWQFVQDFRAQKRFSKLIDESVYSMAYKRFGKEVADNMISPFICGMCAGNIKHISVKYILKSIFDLEQKCKCSIKGPTYELWNDEQTAPIFEAAPALARIAMRQKWAGYSLVGGLQTIVDELTCYLNLCTVDVHTNTTCKNIEFHKNYVRIEADGLSDDILSNHVISSLPAWNLSKLVEKQHPILATHLREIPLVSVVVINLYYKKKIPLHGSFVFLISRKENLPILNITYDNYFFPETEDTMLTVMLGGHCFEKEFGDSPNEQVIFDTTMNHLNKILGISETPDIHNVAILKNSIPQYTTGHEKRLKQIEDYIWDNNLRISVCGSSFYGIGVNEAIYSARLAVERLRRK